MPGAHSARQRAAAAFAAAVGVVLVCLTFRDAQPDRAVEEHAQKSGNFFAEMQPTDDQIDSPDGRKGFALLQASAASSVLRHLAQHSKARVSPGGQRLQELAMDALVPGASADAEVDFLSADAARSEMQKYWQSLSVKTHAEGRGDVQDVRVGHAEKMPSGHGPLTAAEARRQLNDFWSDLGSHEAVKDGRAALRKKASAAKSDRADPVKDTAMTEMEKVWSSESAGKAQLVSKKTGAGVKKTGAGVSEGGRDGRPVSRADDSRTRRFSTLPMCNHCSLQQSLASWPVWNHRVDHALRVAENIAQGSQWNKTLHHVTLGAAADDSGAGDLAGDPDLAGRSDADLKLEVDSAMSSLQAAIAESKAEQVEEEAQEHGTGSASLASAQRTRCLSVCYSEVQSLVGKLTAHRNGKGGSKTAARTEAAAVAARAGEHAVSTPPAGVAAAANKDSGDDDSIENVVDTAEKAVGFSEAAAANAVEQTVHDIVVDPAQGAVSPKKSAAGHLRGGGAVAAKAVESPGTVPGVSPQAVTAAPAAAVPAAAAVNGADVRKLEDSALSDAAQAQEQVRQVNLRKIGPCEPT